MRLDLIEFQVLLTIRIRTLIGDGVISEKASRKQLSDIRHDAIRLKWEIV